jgi:hypothetical protein
MGYLFVEAFCCAPEKRFRGRMLRFQWRAIIAPIDNIKIHSSNFPFVLLSFAHKAKLSGSCELGGEGHNIAGY